MHHLKLWLLAAIVLLLPACEPASTPALSQREAYVFGTRVELVIAEAGGNAAQAEAALSTVLAEFDRLHRTYHAWQQSPLTELNTALAAGKRHPVDHELAALIADSARIAAAGDYLFDPAIGQLVALWGFHAEAFDPVLPDPQALAAWRAQRPSIAGLHVVDGMASTDNRRTALDFGGYLKGVALDRAATLLRQAGIGNALINIGGNILALGSRHGRPWRIGIQHPRQPGPLATLELRDGEAVGTSGDYQRYFEVDGRRYSHLLDPRSAEPVTHTQAVTVLVSPRPAVGMLSDAASKPLFIAGAADWRRLSHALAVDAVLRIDAAGRIEVTPAMQTRLRFVGQPPPLTVVE